MEEGERLEDHYGLLWKKPINKTDEKDCTGWIDFRTKSLHLKEYHSKLLWIPARQVKES